MEGQRELRGYIAGCIVNAVSRESPFDHLWPTEQIGMGGSPGDVGEATRRKGWRTRCDVAEATEGALLALDVT